MEGKNTNLCVFSVNGMLPNVIINLESGVIFGKMYCISRNLKVIVTGSKVSRNLKMIVTGSKVAEKSLVLLMDGCLGIM